MSQKVQEIRFYSTSDEHGCFSNFAAARFTLGGRTWHTSEHYFQAQKFAGTPREEEIRQARSPAIAARMGRSRKHRLRRDWEKVKDAIMREAVLAKFSQNEEHRIILLNTGDAVLIEHTERDSYWGDGGDGSGRNRLGEILMGVREELRHRETVV
ncbi:MAG TPA: NADAR family protein [Gemmataceae bacterium]|nr:NADAR family protein [Gemmataceae bacterium]